MQLCVHNGNPRRLVLFFKKKRNEKDPAKLAIAAASISWEPLATPNESNLYRLTLHIVTTDHSLINSFVYLKARIIAATALR